MRRLFKIIFLIIVTLITVSCENITTIDDDWSIFVDENSNIEVIGSDVYLVENTNKPRTYKINRIDGKRSSIKRNIINKKQNLIKTASKDNLRTTVSFLDVKTK